MGIFRLIIYILLTIAPNIMKLDVASGDSTKNHVIRVKMHTEMTEFLQKLSEFRRIPRNSKPL